MNFKTNSGSLNFKIVVVAVIILIVAMIVLLSSSKKTNTKEAKPLHEYFVFYSISGKTGVIDRKGNKIIEAEYIEVYIPNPMVDVFICISEEKNIILNSKGEEIFKNYEEVSQIIISEDNLDMEEVLLYKKGDLYGLVDLSEKELTDAIYEEVSSLKNKPGYILVKKDGNYGVLDSKGKIVINAEYNSIRGDGYCSEQNGYEKTGYIVSVKTSNGIFYGYIDYKGKKILSTKYELINRILEYDHDTTYLVVMDNGKKGVYKNKKQIIKSNFQAINYSRLSKIFIVQKNGKYGFFNSDGKEILKPEYTDYSVAGNYISVRQNEKMMLYDIHGNLINTDNYISIIETEDPAYFIAVDEKGYYSIISKDVKIENEYTNLEYAFDNYYIFTDKNSQSGVLHIWDGIVIPPKYDSILVTEKAYAIEARNYNDDIVDIYSRKVIKELSISGGVVESINDEYVTIYSDSEMQYIDKNGELVKNTIVFPELKLYSAQSDGKWGFCDKDGRIIVDRKYDIVTELNEYGFAGICQDGKWGVIDEDGNVLIAPTYKIDSYYFPKFIGKYQLQNVEAIYCVELE